ncbi:hypothetical protein C8R47DRAFT_1078645 [Mycena vitilis]|nr:hypothetical protein C8R47DRAFT_1078645 [Mycena vitilis]
MGGIGGLKTRPGRRPVGARRSWWFSGYRVQLNERPERQAVDESDKPVATRKIQQGGLARGIAARGGLLQAREIGRTKMINGQDAHNIINQADSSGVHSPDDGDGQPTLMAVGNSCKACNLLEYLSESSANCRRISFPELGLIDLSWHLTTRNQDPDDSNDDAATVQTGLEPVYEARNVLWSSSRIVPPRSRPTFGEFIKLKGKRASGWLVAA